MLRAVILASTLACVVAVPHWWCSTRTGMKLNDFRPVLEKPSKESHQPLHALHDMLNRDLYESLIKPRRVPCSTAAFFQNKKMRCVVGSGTMHPSASPFFLPTSKKGQSLTS